jgi:uncharacterized protein with HEPN domain
MTREWRDYLADVARYAAAAAQVVEDVELTDLMDDIKTLLALERALEIVGEAASKLPAELRGRYPDVPWQAMIGARNRLAHGYFALDHALLWRTAREAIPPLLPRLQEIARLEGALPPSS